MTRKWMIAGGGVLALILVVAGLTFRSRAVRAQSVNTARVSDVKGRLAVHGGQESAVSYIQRNGVVRHGDTLWTDRGGQGEVELAPGAWIRMGELTKVETLSLSPDPEVRLWNGALYGQVRREFGHTLTVRTPDGDVEIPEDCTARVELSGAETRVRGYRGVVRLIPLNGEPLELRRGQLCALRDGRITGPERPFDPAAAPDGFDRYEMTRLEYLDRYREPGVLTQPLAGAYELDGRGTWVRYRDRAYWRPEQEAGWRPYTHGYWSYVADEGPSWVDDEPWGYTTSHYGRWAYLPNYDGWCWNPDDDWEPAHVAWGSCDVGNTDYVGWAPLGPDDPYNGWDGATYLSYWDGRDDEPDGRCWTFARRDDFFYSRTAYDEQPPYLSVLAMGFGGGGRRFERLRDLPRDFGAPRFAVRGLAVDPSGYAARDTVLRVEDRIPRERYAALQSSFQVAPDRDLRLSRISSPVEGLQRFRSQRIAQGDVIRGAAAARVFDRPSRRANFARATRQDRITRVSDPAVLQRPDQRFTRRPAGGNNQRVAGFRTEHGTHPGGPNPIAAGPRVRAENPRAVPAPQSERQPGAPPSRIAGAVGHAGVMRQHNLARKAGPGTRVPANHAVAAAHGRGGVGAARMAGHRFPAAGPRGGAGRLPHTGPAPRTPARIARANQHAGRAAAQRAFGARTVAHSGRRPIQVAHGRAGFARGSERPRSNRAFASAEGPRRRHFGGAAPAGVFDQPQRVAGTRQVFARPQRIQSRPRPERFGREFGSGGGRSMPRPQPAARPHGGEFRERFERGGAPHVERQATPRPDFGRHGGGGDGPQREMRGGGGPGPSQQPQGGGRGGNRGGGGPHPGPGGSGGGGPHEGGGPGGRHGRDH